MISVTIPLALPSLANARLHWATKARIVKEQRRRTTLGLVTTGLLLALRRAVTGTGTRNPHRASPIRW